MGDAATPQAVVDFLLQQHGITRAALAAILGGRSRVSEFFAGKRRLSISQIQRLRQLSRSARRSALGPSVDDPPALAQQEQTLASTCCRTAALCPSKSTQKGHQMPSIPNPEPRPAPVVLS
jgi:transcriptional regulator with XRE-family HTH domain